MNSINGEIQLLVNNLIFYNSDKAINNIIDKVVYTKVPMLKIKIPLLRNNNQVWDAIQNKIGYYNDIF